MTSDPKHSPACDAAPDSNDSKEQAPLNRRSFLRGASAIVGALALPPALARVTQAQPERATLPAQAGAKAEVARGVVFHDKDKSGKAGPANPPLPGVRVSNGREIVTTDAAGRYELPVEEGTILFVQKPSGYRVPLDERNLPRFYYIHRPAGSPTNFKYAGLAPTGPLPASIDFGLRAQQESDEFRVLMFGDPQPRNLQEVDFLARDVVRELAGVEAAFGLSLGDNAFNDLSTLEPLNDVTAQIGLPWHTIIGNHDLNFEAPDDTLSSETFKRHYGPTYYSMDYGPTHFVFLDNVVWLGPGTPARNANYTGGFGEKQLAWLKADLDGVPRDKLVVLLMHIPIAVSPDAPTESAGANAAERANGKPTRFIEADRRAFLALLQDRPRTVSISGHTHVQYHAYVGREQGWNGAEPHHHFNCGTTSGSWWSGAPDESGIPHTTMRDGVPNGYAFLRCKGSGYSVQWQAARRPADYQMNIFAPSSIAAPQAAATPVVVNLFNGCERSTVEMRLGKGGAWTPLKRTVGADPGYLALKGLEAEIPAFEPAPAPAMGAAPAGKDPAGAKPLSARARRRARRLSGAKPPWRPLPAIDETPHLWRANLPALAPGVHEMEVRAMDGSGRTCSEKRILRVV